MGRKGVSKRKKAKEKSGPAAGSISALLERKPDVQPEQVVEKGKTSSKDKAPSRDKKKH